MCRKNQILVTIGAAAVAAASLFAAADTNTPHRIRLSPVEGVGTGTETDSIAMLPAVEGISPSIVAPVLPSAYVAGVFPSRLNAVLSIMEQGGVPLSSVAELFAEAAVAGLPATEVVRAIEVGYAIGISPEDMAALLSAAIAADNGVVSFNVMSLAPLGYQSISGVKSRFDMLSPAMFSTLWNMKRLAKLAEARGENTDELWHQF